MNGESDSCWLASNSQLEVSEWIKLTRNNWQTWLEQHPQLVGYYLIVPDGWLKAPHVNS